MNDSIKAQAEKAYSLYEELTSYESGRRAANIKVGDILRQLRSKNFFKKAIGGDRNWTWREFLAQPEVGIPEREAEFLMKLSTLYTDYPDVINVPTPSMKVLADKVDDEEDHTLTISDAVNLSTTDLKEQYHSRKTNDAPQTYTYLVMKRSNETGNMRKVWGVTSDDIETKLKEKL